TSTQSFTVTEPSVLTSASSSGSIACNGGTTTVSVSANGGTAPYTGTGNYTVGAGNYNYIVTDANGCTASTSITVTQPNLLTASSSSGNITCNGGSTTVTVSGNGGTTPYTGTGNFTVSAGNYNYSVSDANGCTASTSIVVTEPSPLTASITSNAPNATICSGGTAVLTASVAGGLGTVNYQWQYQSGSSWINVTGWSGTNVATPFVNSRNASPSNTRAYRIVVTSSTNNQCSVTASQLVTVIPDPVITITSTNISCFGANDGTASASISGGLPLNYGFNWYSNDNNSNNNNPAGDGTLNVTGLFPAQWVINTTVSGSSFGCYTEASVLITEPSALISSSSASAILCNGGSSTVSVSATGGTAPYTGTGSFTETAGDYSYTVTDANGCTSVTDITIYQPTPLKVTTTQGKIPCFGGTADIDVQAEGGTPPYTGAGTYNVSAGTYVYTVTDANGCSVSVTVTMPQPTQVVASSTYTPILCNGASSQVNVTGTGGTGTLTGVGDYEATAGTYTYVVTDENGCESSTTVTITEPSVLESSSSATSILCNGGTAVVSVAANGGTAPYTGTGTFTEVAGSYSYTVTDANGCQAITSITITEPTLLTASSSSSNFNGYGVSCNGGNNGSISVSATGGVAPYSSTGAYNNLSAGSYSYTVTDANGCTATTSNTITEPTLLTASSSSSNFNGYGVSCNGGNNGSISVSATGGVAPYSSTGAYNNLSAGSYSYTVTDANGCAATTSNTITEPTLLTASSSSGSIACNGGTTAVIVSADGGTTPYVGTGSFTVVAGSYNYTVTDANGCQAATSISISQPTAVIVSAGNDATVYFGYAPSACTTLNASANGGTGSLTYTWNNGTNGSSNTVCPSSSTSYTVTATDANGCQASDAVNVCVINVVCYAGGSNVAKVEVCHNGNSICISPTSVASHLAHGDALGSCVEVNACNTVTQAVRLSDDHSKEIFISLFPNPATNNVTVLYEGADELSVVEFVVYNALGEQIINGQLKHGETDINISLLTPGVYFLKTSDLNAKPIRFIKE
ncbi:MAG: T9SS type A sorting domain-containing protein, partial [Bacteroidota bacterium]